MFRAPDAASSVNTRLNWEGPSRVVECRLSPEWDGAGSFLVEKSSGATCPQKLEVLPLRFYCPHSYDLIASQTAGLLVILLKLNAQNYLEDPELQFIPMTQDQLTLAQEDIESCQACDPEAEIPFDWVIEDHATSQGYVDYILPAPAKCTKCKAEIREETLR